MRTLKNIISKSLLLTALYYSLLLVESCCHCEASNIQKFNYSSIWTQNEAYQIKGDSSFTIRSYSEDSITKGNYGLSLYLEPSYAAIQRKDFGASLINKAYACKCKVGYEIRDSIERIEIVTLNDFDGLHPRGTAVTDHFVQLGRNGGKIIEEPVNSDIEDHNFITDARAPVGISLYLKNYPSLGNELRFDIRVHFKSGKVFNYFSRPIIIH